MSAVGDVVSPIAEATGIEPVKDAAEVLSNARYNGLDAVFSQIGTGLSKKILKQDSEEKDHKFTQQTGGPRLDLAPADSLRQDTIKAGNDSIPSSLEPTAETVRPKVRDMAFAEARRESAEKFYWLRDDKDYRDSMGNKYYQQRSIPLNDSMSASFMNSPRSEGISRDTKLKNYQPVRSDMVVPIMDFDHTTPGKFISYGEMMNFKRVKKDRQAEEEKREHTLHRYIGVSQEGTIKVGPIEDFTDGDMIAPIDYAYYVSPKRDKNGNIMFGSGCTSVRYAPKIITYGEDVVNPDGTIKEGVVRDSSLGVSSSANKKEIDSFGQLAGGHLIAECDGELRFIEGSGKWILDELEAMKKNHDTDRVRIYWLDQGSYNRGMSTDNGMLTARDWSDYWNQNPSGGTALLLTKRATKDQMEAIYEKGRQYLLEDDEIEELKRKGYKITFE